MKKEKEFTNTLYTNDNLFILNGLNSNLVDLIYLDPPFNTNKIFSAPIGTKAAGTSFKDMWTWADVNEAYLETLTDKYPALVKFIASIGKIHSKAMMAYLTYMVQRIIEMHRILKDTGSLYLHCDQTASHYLKILLDDIFGKNNFRNEIAWCYSTGGKSKRHFGRKKDIILFYSKTNKYIFNGESVSIQMTPHKQNKSGEHYGGKMGTDEYGREYVEKQGSKDSQGNYKYYRYYLDEGKIPEDWWVDINSLQSAAKERTGYSTQKPLALLKRIIKASSNEGNIVMDPFCGCATTCVAAQQLGRKWIGIDLEENAVGLLMERLGDDANMFKDFKSTKLIPQRTDVSTEPYSPSMKEQLYKEQNGICNGCGNKYLIKDLDKDHIIPVDKGGGDYYENYQLLCGHCNSIKKNRPMEYLRMKIKAREELIKNKIEFGE